MGFIFLTVHTHRGGADFYLNGEKMSGTYRAVNGKAEFIN